MRRNGDGEETVLGDGEGDRVMPRAGECPAAKGSGGGGGVGCSWCNSRSGPWPRDGSQPKITSVGQSIRPRDEHVQSNGPTSASRRLRPRDGGRIDITAGGKWMDAQGDPRVRCWLDFTRKTRI